MFHFRQLILYYATMQADDALSAAVRLIHSKPALKEMNGSTPRAPGDILEAWRRPTVGEAASWS
jgi:hypothetical protein